MSNTEFIPRWASPPGDTIKDALRERSLSERDLSGALGLPHELIEELLIGSIPLTIEVADGLTGVVGGSVEFWMTRDGQYRADLLRVAADDWVKQLPVRDMSELGWIPVEPSDWLNRIDSCLRFFDVKDYPTWEANRSALLGRTRFRSSKTVATDEFAVAAWIRESELELSQVECGVWNRDGFRSLLTDLLPLTRVSDPQEFLPTLRGLCADVGVAVGVIRAPRGCPISGAARRLSTGQLTIALTGRFRTDDHLWFTFFHEAAHLILHDNDALYLDEIDAGPDLEVSAVEVEADRFAGEILVPPDYESALAAARRTPFELRRLAHEIGVSTGIVVGHLQHRGLLGHGTRLNRLKRRYKWAGPNLEKA